MSSAPRAPVTAYLADCRERALSAIVGFVPSDARMRDVLYGPMLDYPFRPAKGIRPALCIAACGALGGRPGDATRSAAVLELYHNAFLIHDDVEDGSEKRREGPTLHRVLGPESAINVADAMLAVALRPLLDNTRDLGVGPALRILEIVARMSRESAEGQAIELDWIRRDEWHIRDREYVQMVHKKTGWYSFIAPVTMGAVIANAPRERASRLARFAALLGVAFQIRDDLLNLTGREDQVGKEAMDDILEGKRTLMLLHATRAASPETRARLARVVGSRRTTRPLSSEPDRGEIAWVVDEMRRSGSLDHARAVAIRYAERARRELQRAALSPSVHADILSSLVDYVIDRDR